MISSDPNLSVEDQLIAQLPNLRAFARGLAHDRTFADDLVQEAFEKAWKKRHRYENGTNMRAWLFTILRNTFISGTRTRRREIADTDGVHAGRVSVPPSQDSAIELAELRLALKQLPVLQREAVVLVGAAGFTYDEAAAICDCAVGTVKSRVSRARQKLFEMLEPGDNGLAPVNSAVRQITSVTYPYCPPVLPVNRKTNGSSAGVDIPPCVCPPKGS